MIFEKNHPSIAMTLNNIAMTYKKQSDFQNALEVYTQALYLTTSESIEEMDYK
jgi:hypothetical protein